MEHKRGILVLGDEYVETIVGYRRWTLDVLDGEVKLSGWTYQHQPWPQVGPLTAVCDKAVGSLHIRSSPVPGCTCGVYARRSTRPPGLTGLFGEVHLWGKVICHEGGYRAQFARPACFYTPEDDAYRCYGLTAEQAELASVQYGVPLVRAVR